MLGLKLATDPRWADLASENIAEILTDHAYCEQKAATNAINLMIMNPGLTDLVDAMIEIAREELLHFQMVHQKIKERGFTLGLERKDDYVAELNSFIRKGHGREIALIDRLLFAAMVEARSCERFKVLSENIADPDLKVFYHELMKSEAGHYATFIGFARKYANGHDVDQRWKEFIDFETSIITRYGKKETMHG